MRCVFLHGLAGEPEDFHGVRALLPGWHTHAPEIDYFSGRFESLEELADQVHAGLPAAFRDQPCLAVGNSLGGVLALVLAGRFERTILAGSHIELGTGFLGRGRGVLATELERIFHDPAALSSERVARYEQRWQEFAASRTLLRRLRPLKRMLQSFGDHQHYARGQERITLVCGASDRISPLGRCRELAVRYPRMGFEVLPACGHAVPIEQPRALARILEHAKKGGVPRKKCLQPDFGLDIVSSCTGGKCKETC